jgi:hypothetical protein
LGGLTSRSRRAPEDRMAAAMRNRDIGKWSLLVKGWRS